MPPIDAALAILYAVAGVLVAALFSLAPSLHVYNVAGIVVLVAGSPGTSISPRALAFFFLGLTTGYAMLNTIPSVFLAAPDESTVFIVLPGQRYARQGRGFEAAVLTGIGGLLAILALALLAMVAYPLFRQLRDILQPHLHWILWAVIAWMLLSEWPKGSDRAPPGWRRWWEAWRSLAAGLLTFLLSGLLGLILFYRNPVPETVAFQGMLPAFVGLFAVPWVIQNILSRLELPPQHVPATVDATPWLLVRGALTGVAGGLFAAFFPAVTGGIGAMIAGHATAQRDDRLFLISQGSAKVAYYVGALLFFFVPGLHMARGGMASMLSSLWSAHTPQTYYLAVAAIVLSGVSGFLLLLPLSRLAARLIGSVRYRTVSVVTLAVQIAIVLLFTGWPGLVVCAVASGIGLIPALWGSRRVNCMGVILLPLALELTGAAGTVAGWLGLLR